MESKRLIKKTGLYFIGNLSSKILTFLLIPLYAYKIRSEDFGYYDYAQTIMNIAVPICFVAIWEAILKYILQEDDEREKDRVMATSCLFTIVMSFVSVLALIIYNAVVSEKVQALYYIIAMVISYAVMFIWQYYARALGENRIYVLTGIIGTVINFAANIVMICIFDIGLSSLFISYILGNFTIVVILEARLKILLKLRRKNISIRVLKKMLTFSAPLVLNLISTWLITGFGRMIIKDRLGTYANGLYAFANKFAIVISMLGSVINMAIIEEALISAKKNGIGESFVLTIENLFKIFQSMIILAAPAIAFFYFTIKGTDYYISMPYFPMLLLYSLIMIMTTSFGTVFQIINKTKYQFITTTLGAVVTVIISYLFIERAGLFAVIIAQVLGAVVMLLSRYVFINKYVLFKIKWTPIICMLIAYMAVSAICVMTPVFVSIIVFIAGAVILAYLNRGYATAVINMIKRFKR